MVQFYGRVSGETPSNGGSLILAETCRTTCLNDVECILAFMNSDGYCKSYKFAEIQTELQVEKSTDGDETFMVAIKTNEIVCPTSFETMEFAYVDRRNGANYPFQWKKTDAGWSISNLCPSPWTIFKRTAQSIFVCLGTFPISNLNQAEASNFCINLGLLVGSTYRLTGIASFDEKGFITQGYARVWVDGYPDCPESEPIKADTKWLFNDEYTIDPFISIYSKSNTARCLQVISTEYYHYTEDCSDRTPVGAACGFKMPDI